MSEPFVGEIRLWPLSYAPRDWGYCDGSILSVAQHSILFAVIANFYGGNGQSTMALPNLMARSVIGSGKGPGLTQRNLTEELGIPVMNILNSELPLHNHTAYGARGFGINASGAGCYNVARYEEQTGTVIPSYKVGTPNDAYTAAPETLAITGSGESHENMQPYLTLSYCIALDGIYPQHS